MDAMDWDGQHLYINEEEEKNGADEEKQPDEMIRLSERSGVEDLYGRIGQLARTYTPEWQFDRENPDIGTALAVVYTEMLYKTCRLIPEMMPKSRICMYNLFSADLRPAVAAKGYVTFSLVNDRAPGVMVERGTRVYGEYQGKRVYAETVQDLYVTPASVERIIQADNDFIGDSAVIEEGYGTAFFDRRGRNRQEHVMYLCHSEVFAVSNGEIFLYFGVDEAEMLVSKNAAEIFYSSDEGWQPFGRRRWEAGSLVLKRDAGCPAPAGMSVEGRWGVWIGIRVRDPEPYRQFVCHKIMVRSESVRIKPMAVYGAGIPCVSAEFEPFGTDMGRFKEVAFASGEALGKSGAVVTLGFTVSFRKTPLPGNTVREIKWKRVMKAKDLEEPAKYDLSVKEVIWEYFNGRGWHRLFSDRTGTDLFTPDAHAAGGYRELTFICPSDMAPVSVESVEECYIRARVLTMSNEYKQEGDYVTPVVSDSFFSYAYQVKGVLPEYVVTRNNLVAQCYVGKELGETSFFPFQDTGIKCPSVYWKMKRPPIGGPITMLLQLEERMNERTCPVQWDYYSTQGWRKLEVSDGTDHLRKTGLVSFSGSEDFCRMRLFEEEGYWIRLCDRQRYYDQGVSCPVVTGIYMNTTVSCTIMDRKTEFFRMNRYEPDRQYTLQGKGILSSELWVDEGGDEPEWTSWELRENLGESAPGERHYSIDAHQGLLRFGDGYHGRIPEVSRRDNIRIDYRTGGGAYTNIPEGTISRMEKSIGFINRVTNPLEFAGGSDRETVKQALERNGARFRHKDRALTPGDFEELAMNTFPEILQAVCFAGYHSGGYKEAGYITLVIVQRNMKTGYLYFEELRQRMEAFLHPRMGCFLAGRNYFRIIPAVLAEVHVKVTVAVNDPEDLYNTVRKISEICDDFLHTGHGNVHKKGWKIGEFPEPEQIRYAIGRQHGVVRKIALSCFLCSGKRKEACSMERIKGHPFILPVSGTHQVIVEGGNHAAGY